MHYKQTFYILRIQGNENVYNNVMCNVMQYLKNIAA